MATGRAYGFFDCRKSRGVIESYLPRIRSLSRIPRTVGLHLRDGMKELGENFRYAMEAACPDATNKAAAGELAACLNQAYQSPLWTEGEPFRGRGVYERGGRYVDIP